MIDRQTSPTSLKFVQHCQVTAGDWHDLDYVGRAAAVCNCLDRIPPSAGVSDRVTVSSAVLRLAWTFIGNMPNDRHVDRSATRQLTQRVRAELALQTLRRQFADPGLDLHAAAVSAGTSTWHLSRILRRETDFGVTAHLNAVRILRAAMDLRSTSLSVKEIAAAVGYASSSELDRQFHNRLYISPMEFRSAIPPRVERKPDEHRLKELAVEGSHAMAIADTMSVDFGLVIRIWNDVEREVAIYPS